MHFSWETKQRDAAIVGSFTPVSLFAYGDDQFANLSVPFQNAMPLDTLNQTIRRSEFRKLPMKLFAISSKLGFSSGIRELIDIQFFGNFHLCKVKKSRPKNFAQFRQVRCQCWQKESSMLKLFVFIRRSKTTHIASFLFSNSCFSAAQIAKISLLALTAASLDNHLVLNARCNCRPFVLIVVWCIARQADRNGETIKHFHNSGQQIFGLVFIFFYFLVFLHVFWCAESENDVSFFVVSAVFL